MGEIIHLRIWDYICIMAVIFNDIFHKKKYNKTWAALTCVVEITVSSNISFTDVFFAPSDRKKQNKKKHGFLMCSGGASVNSIVFATMIPDGCDKLLRQSGRMKEVCS